MNGKLRFFGIIAVALIIGFSMTACNNGTTGGGEGYYYAIYQISAATYNAIQSDWTISEAMDFIAKQQGTSRRETYNNRSIDSFKVYLRDRGFSESSISNYAGTLENGGALVVWYAGQSSTYWLIHATKE